MLASMWEENNYMHFLQSCSTPFVKSSWQCAHQRWHLHFNQHCHCPPNASRFTSLILCDSRICNPWHISSQRKELSQLTPHWSNPPFNNWQLTYLGVYTNKLICFYKIVAMPFGAWKGQRALIFLFWLLCFVTKFQSHCKGCKPFPSQVKW
jgi:hypothetical protein